MSWALDLFMNVINNPHIRRPIRKVLDHMLDDHDTNIALYNAHTHMFGHADMGLSKAGLGIDANTEDVQTSAAFQYCINGVCYELATQAAIDISAIGTYTPSAIATATQAIVLFCVNAAGAIHAVQGAAHATAAVCPDTPAGYVPFGYVKIVNASGSPFTPGTTGLDTANVTDTYVDLVFSPVGANGQGITSTPGTDTGDVDAGTASTMVQNVTH